MFWIFNISGTNRKLFSWNSNNTTKELGMNQLTELKQKTWLKYFKKACQRKAQKNAKKNLLEKQSRGSKGDGSKYKSL